MTQKISHLTVIPGWAEGKRQLRRTLQLLAVPGRRVTFEPKIDRKASYEAVLAHSGGCYQHWSVIQADQLILIAPPFLSDKQWTNREMIRRAKQRSKQAGDGVYKLRLTSRLRFLLSVKSTIRHREAVRSIALIDELHAWLKEDRSRKLLVLIYKGDPWTDETARDGFSLLERTRVIYGVGDHDDFSKQPEKLFQLLARQGDLNLIES